jgi:amino acid transporter
LTYAFVDWPLEITDNFLAYLIPFIIALIGLIFLIWNFYAIKKLNGRLKKMIFIANIIATIIFVFLLLFNIPIPEKTGLRCKNWTDTEMLINPADTSEQYVYQTMEISGSIFSFRQLKVTEINSWLRWKHVIDKMPKSGRWLYIDNTKNGYNTCPFSPDYTKIIFDRNLARIVTLNDGLITK